MVFGGHADNGRRSEDCFCVCCLHVLRAVSILLHLQAQVNTVSAIDAASVRTISQEEYEAIKSLWKDGGIQSAYERRREFHLSDSAK